MYFVVDLGLWLSDKLKCVLIIEKGKGALDKGSLMGLSTLNTKLNLSKVLLG